MLGVSISFVFWWKRLIGSRVFLIIFRRVVDLGVFRVWVIGGFVFFVMSRELWSLERSVSLKGEEVKGILYGMLGFRLVREYL